MKKNNLLKIIIIPLLLLFVISVNFIKINNKVSANSSDCLENNCTGTYQNGFCTICDDYQDCSGTGSETDPYLISNAGQLYTFAEKVLAAGGSDVNAKLLNDIVITHFSDGKKRDWLLVGLDYSNRYNGIFDGNHKTISGLYYNNEDTFNVGFLGFVSHGAIVKNLGIIDSYFYGYYNVGGIAGTNIGTITGCYNASTVDAKGSNNSYGYIGGIAGLNSSTIINCYNDIDLSTESRCIGGIAGKNTAHITNCYNTKNIYGYGSVDGLVANNLQGTITNCYSKSHFSFDGTIINCEERVDLSRFASGEIAFKLGDAFGQNIDNNKPKQNYPTFNGAKVFYGYTTCDENIEKVYTNNELATDKKPDHDFDENGDCNNCEKKAEAKIENKFYTNFEVALGEVKTDETIYCYINYDKDFTIPQGVIFNGGTNEFSGCVTNNGTINNGKFTNQSSGATDEEEDFPGFGELVNGEESNAFGIINNGIINNGQFLGKTENNGIINNGTFNNDLTNNINAEVTNGLFYGTITNYGEFSGGKTINKFDNYGIINGGEFTVFNNLENGIINSGNFSSISVNNGTINNLNEGDIFLNNWFTVPQEGTINCEAHIRTNASNEYVCTCRVCKDIKHYDSVTDAYVSPTCSKTGLTEGSHCSACDEVFIAQVTIDALGVTADKQFHTDLNKDKICDHCGYKYSLPAIAIVGIVAGSIIIIGALTFVTVWFIRKKKHSKT